MNDLSLSDVNRIGYLLSQSTPLQAAIFLLALCLLALLWLLPVILAYIRHHSYTPAIGIIILAAGILPLGWIPAWALWIISLVWAVFTK